MNMMQMHTAGAPSNELVGFDEVRDGVRWQGRHIYDHAGAFLWNASEYKNVRHGASYTKNRKNKPTVWNKYKLRASCCGRVHIRH